MLKVDFGLKKASVRTMLPVASVGFSGLWALFLLALLSPALGSTGVDVLFLRLGFIAGVLSVMVVFYLKRDIATEENAAASLFAMAFLSGCAGLSDLLCALGLPVPAFVQVVLWVLAGCGFSLTLLQWMQVFLVAWRRDVGVFLSLGGVLGAMAYLFSSNLLAPYGSLALVLLPLFSLLSCHYIVSHIVGGSPMPEDNGQQPRFFLSTGVSVLLFGMAFGVALYVIAAQVVNVGAAPVALAVALGAGAHVALGVLAKKFPPFSVAEKCALLLSAVGFVVMAALGDWWMLVGGVYLLAVWTYLDFANLSALVGFASSHKSPLWSVARGWFVMVLGLGVSWVACLALGRLAPDALAFLPFGGLVAVGACAAVAIFKPFQDNTFLERNVDGAVATGGTFTRRVERAARDYRLSRREGEVLVFLAKGRNAQYISEQLCISPYTAKTHVYHIYQKMGVGSQQELISLVDAVEVEEL